ncbi:MAG: ATP phosphoribosyltransferase [Bacteroidota bacterium]
MQEKLKIAIQKSGRLNEDSLKILRECSIKIDNGKDQLKAAARNFPLEVLYLRNSDIPKYIEDGVAHLGIIGENLVLEKQCNIKKVLQLGFSKCRLSIAVPKSVDYPGLDYLNGKRIATSYPNSLRQFLEAKQLRADIHEISGSVEIAPNIGLADAICDLVSSGSTLFKNNLIEREVVLQSEACIVAPPNLPTSVQTIYEQLIFRIKSVLAAKNNKYLLMNVPDQGIEDIIKILPGMKSPTVMPLAKEGWSSVHTVIKEQDFWEIISQLKAKGAEGILIIPIEKMIL